MKSLIIFVTLFAVALARPSDEQIIRSESNVEPHGFQFAVETSDGSNHIAEGHLKDIGTEHESLVVHGSFSFVADDGKTYSIEYTADENGFQAVGEHLPVGLDAQ